MPRSSMTYDLSPLRDTGWDFIRTYSKWVDPITGTRYFTEHALQIQSQRMGRETLPILPLNRIEGRRKVILDIIKEQARTTNEIVEVMNDRRYNNYSAWIRGDVRNTIKYLLHHQKIKIKSKLGRFKENLYEIDIFSP